MCWRRCCVCVCVCWNGCFLSQLISHERQTHVTRRSISSSRRCSFISFSSVDPIRRLRLFLLWLLFVFVRFFFEIIDRHERERARTAPIKKKKENNAVAAQTWSTSRSNQMMRTNYWHVRHECCCRWCHIVRRGFWTRLTRDILAVNTVFSRSIETFQSVGLFCAQDVCQRVCCYSRKVPVEFGNQCRSCQRKFLASNNDVFSSSGNEVFSRVIFCVLHRFPVHRC